MSRSPRDGSRRDEIDPKLARHFAWSFVRADESESLAESLRAFEEEARAAATATPATPAAAAGASGAAADPQRDDDSPALDPQTAQKFRERARAACRPIAKMVEQAWAADEGAEQLAVVEKLVSRAGKLSFELVAMGDYPREAVRLLRLIVRHGPKLGKRRRKRAVSIAPWVPLDGDPDLAELLVEIARAGDEAMAGALLLDDEWVPHLEDADAVVARLADVIDDGPTHAARRVAIDLLDLFADVGCAVDALERALRRLPSFGVRARALGLLANTEPCALDPSDLVMVLRELATHPPPESADHDGEEDERIMAEAIVEALRHVRPDEARDALLDVIDAERHRTLWLDEAWATEALAVGFPETAATMVDHWLACAHAYERRSAMAALRELPRELAEPRLRIAAADPAADVREAARDIWAERFGEALATDPSALVGAALLQGPPSDRFASRLGVIHGRVSEARDAMVRVLLAEDDREALVLLLQLVADDGFSSEPMPYQDGEQGLAFTIAKRFGAAAAEGLCAVASRFREPESLGWMRRLGDLVENGAIDREHAAPLRALAMEQVTSENAGWIDDALRVLSLVGTPPEALERLLAIALDDSLGAWQASKLLVAWPDRALDVRLASEMAMALAERRYGRLEEASGIALRREAPAARVVAQRVVELADSDPDVVDAAATCARWLHQCGALGDEWALGALAHPESPAFTVATIAWCAKGRALRQALEAALASGARDGAAAAEAAVALLHGQPPMSPRDRRIPPLLQRAPAPERARLVYALCMRCAPLALVAPHLEELLASDDPRVSFALRGVFVWIDSPKGRALLRRALPRITDAELRGEVEDHLGVEPPPYWSEEER